MLLDVFNLYNLSFKNNYKIVGDIEIINDLLDLKKTSKCTILSPDYNIKSGDVFIIRLDGNLIHWGVIDSVNLETGEVLLANIANWIDINLYLSIDTMIYSKDVLFSILETTFLKNTSDRYRNKPRFGLSGANYTPTWSTGVDRNKISVIELLHSFYKNAGIYLNPYIEYDKLGKLNRIIFEVKQNETEATQAIKAEDFSLLDYTTSEYEYNTVDFINEAGDIRHETYFLKTTGEINNVVDNKITLPIKNEIITISDDDLPGYNFEAKATEVIGLVDDFTYLRIKMFSKNKLINVNDLELGDAFNIYYNNKSERLTLTAIEYIPADGLVYTFGKERKWQ